MMFLNAVIMSEEKRRDSVENGPGQAYLPFVLMEDFFDKLKLLNFEPDFYREIKLKPMSRHYFALPTNPGEQFYLFSALCAWLIRKSGKKYDTPQEFDDPNSTISNILDVLKQWSIYVDFPPNKLKQGYGEQAIYVLDKLADTALTKTNFIWKRPEYKSDAEEDETAADRSSAAVSESVEEMIEEDFDIVADEEDDNDEGDLLDLDGLRILSSTNLGNGKNDFNKPEAIMESNIDMSEWKLEIERVLPQLKVTVRSDSKDWRSHLEQTHQHRKEIDESLSTTKTQLDKLNSEISHSLEKINSREKYLNNQLEQLVLEYRTAQSHLAQVKDQYNAVSGGVTERSRTLSQITEELEQIKQEMDERGSNMTDGKPLVNIRKALSKLKTELSQMDVRIGVASHTLLQAKLKEKGNLQRAANVASNLASFNVIF